MNKIFNRFIIRNIGNTPGLRVFNSFQLTENKNLLGRWNIQYDNNIIYRKIDQANEDHCGCCVNEFIIKTTTEMKTETEDLNEEEEYMIPYCM